MRLHGSFAGFLGCLALVTVAVPAIAQIPTDLPEGPPPKAPAAAPEAPPASDPAASPANPAPASPSAAPPAASAKANPGPAAKSDKASDNLPWLAPPAPGGKPADKKTAAKTAVKCEEQQEDSCRTLPNCAWVAHMPQPDGTLAAPRCAEKKAPGPVKKTTTAAKPKPKPQPKPDTPVTAEPAKTDASASNPSSGESAPPKESTSKPSDPPKDAAAEAPKTDSPGLVVVEPPAPPKAPEAPPVQAVVKVPAVPAPAAETVKVSPAPAEAAKPKAP